MHTYTAACGIVPVPAPRLRTDNTFRFNAGLDSAVSYRRPYTAFPGCLTVEIKGECTAAGTWFRLNTGGRAPGAEPGQAVAAVPTAVETVLPATEPTGATSNRSLAKLPF